MVGISGWAGSPRHRAAQRASAGPGAAKRSERAAFIRTAEHTGAAAAAAAAHFSLCEYTETRVWRGGARRHAAAGAAEFFWRENDSRSAWFLSRCRWLPLAAALHRALGLAQPVAALPGGEAYRPLGASVEQSPVCFLKPT